MRRIRIPLPRAQGPTRSREIFVEPADLAGFELARRDIDDPHVQVQDFFRQRCAAR
jgi:hypothetical protein